MSNRKPPPLRDDGTADDGVSQPSRKTGDDGPLYSIGGGSRYEDEPPPSTISRYAQRRSKSIVERIQVGDSAEGAAAVHELLEIVEDRLDDVIQGRVNTAPRTKHEAALR